MSISDRTRRLLWGRSAARCAICRRHLVESATGASEASIVGEEAHIVARSPGGPRYQPLAPAEVNHVDNLILLCRIHHKQVDDQTGDFTVEGLRELKANHEALMQVRTADPSGVDQPSAVAPAVLSVITTGTQLWDVIADAMAYRVSGLEDEEASPEICDAVDSALQQIVDWGDIARDVKAQGFAAVRDAKRLLDAELVRLRELDLRLFGLARLEPSGYPGTGDWVVATVAVRFAADKTIVVVR